MTDYIGQKQVGGGTLSFGATDPTTGTRQELYTKPGTPVPVITADKAQEDLAKKQTFLNQTEQQMNQQSVLNTQTKAQKQADYNAQKQADALAAQKQSEIDAKNKLTGAMDGVDNFYGLENVTPGEQSMIKQGYTKDQILKLREDPNAFRFAPTDENGLPITTAYGTKTIGQQQQEVLKQMDQNIQNLNTSMEQLNNGTFPLTPSEQASISAVQASFDRLKQQQIVANQNYEGGITQLGITSGRARYAGEIEMGNIQKAVGDGIQRISQIEQDAAAAVNNLKSAIEDKNYKRINDSYDKIDAALKEKSRVLEEMQNTVNEEADNMVKVAKAKQEEASVEAAAKQDKIKNLSTLAFKSLTGNAEADAKTIGDMAELYDLDPNMLLNAVYEKETENQKTNKATGDVGQWLSAVDSGAVPQGTSYSEFLKLQEDAKSNPLDNIYKQAQIDKIKSDLANGNTVNPSDKIKYETDLRKEFNGLETTKQFNTIKQSYSTVKSAYEEAKKAGENQTTKSAADQVLIVAFNKMIDPNSVVREGEFARTTQGQSIINRLKGSVDKALSGGTGLSDNDRDAIKSATETLYKDYLKLNENKINEYRGLSGSYGIDPNNVVKDETLDDYITIHPESFNEINAVRESALKVLGREPTDEDIVEALKAKTSDLSMSGKGSAALAKVVAKPDGTKGGQCGHFVNQVTKIGVGDSYKSKLAKMDPTIKTPGPGMVFVMPTNGATSENGHVGIILSVNNGIATVKDSNWKGNETILTHQIPISKMTGFKKIS